MMCRHDDVKTDHDYWPVTGSMPTRLFFVFFCRWIDKYRRYIYIYIYISLSLSLTGAVEHLHLGSGSAPAHPGVHCPAGWVAGDGAVLGRLAARPPACDHRRPRAPFGRKGPPAGPQPPS